MKFRSTGVPSLCKIRCFKCWRNKNKQTIHVSRSINDDNTDRMRKSSKNVVDTHEVSTIRVHNISRVRKSSLKQTKGDVKNWKYHLTNEHL